MFFCKKTKLKMGNGIKSSSKSSTSPIRLISQGHPTGQISQADLDLWLRYVSSPQPLRCATPTKSLVKKTKIDLHGYSVNEAHAVAKNFIMDHLSAGSDEIVVVTGRRGQITKEFRSWVELIPGVVSCSPILDSRGQHGAYRLKLRRGKPNLHRR